MSETKSKSSSPTSTILRVSPSSEYILYNSSMGSSWFMTLYVEKEEKIANIEKKLGRLKAKVAVEERDVRRTLKPLREVWLEVGIEKLDNHKGVTVKALLDSGAIGIFMGKKFVEEYGFRLEKLD